MLIDLQRHYGNKELYHVGELSSKIIRAMQTHGSVVLYSKESKNGYNNGLFDLLDQLCAFWGWDKSKITIKTHSSDNVHPEYPTVFVPDAYTHRWLDYKNPVYSWNGEKYYGMFIGRANSTRIRAIHNHMNFKYKDKGLTSFHQNLFEYMSYPDLVEYFMNSNQTYYDMIKIQPYSDIKDLVDTPDRLPILEKYACNGWERVYEKIAIEIVCETITEPNSWDISEKLFRPLYYKRPFMVIGTQNYLDRLHWLGYKTFSHVLDEQYDILGITDFHRVDRIFKILEELIDSGKIETIVDDCSDILEHNHDVLVNKKYDFTKLIEYHKKEQERVRNEK